MPPDPDCPIAGPNPLSPDQMSAKARLREAGRILAAGLTRMSAAKSSSFSAETGDRFVDFPPQKSGGGHETRTPGGGKT